MGNPVSSTLVSCRHSTSGFSRSSQVRRRSSRARIELIFQVASFTQTTYRTAPQSNRGSGVGNVAGPRGVLDPRTPSNVRIGMKPQNDLSLWTIIERLQRRLERQGMPPATADRALSLALRQL